jgi:hypothetical protein
LVLDIFDPLDLTRAGYPLGSVQGGWTGSHPRISRGRASVRRSCDQSLFGESQPHWPRGTNVWREATSPTWGRSLLKKHRQRGAISNVADRLDPLRVSAAGLSSSCNPYGFDPPRRPNPCAGGPRPQPDESEPDANVLGPNLPPRIVVADSQGGIIKHRRQPPHACGPIARPSIAALYSQLLCILLDRVNRCPMMSIRHAQK